MQTTLIAYSIGIRNSGPTPISHEDASKHRQTTNKKWFVVLSKKGF